MNEPDDLDAPGAAPAVDAVAVDAAPGVPVAMPTPPAGWHPDPSVEERAERFHAAQHGDMEALQHVLWWMVAAPERGARVMDLPGQVRRNMMEASTDPRDHLTLELMQQSCEMMHADLLGACGGSPVERLLIDRIVTCWLAAYLADGSAALGGKYAHRDNEYYLRRQDRAHRRLLQSVEALARLQRLMRPGPLVTLAQLNIAQPGAQQLNVAPTAAPSLLPQHSPATPLSTYPYAASSLESPCSAP